MNSELFKIGDRRPEWIYPGSLIRSDYNSLTWMLTIGFPDITEQEVEELQSGSVSFAFTVINNTIFLLFKFGRFEWMDTPYEPRLNHESTYVTFPENTGAALTLFIVDSAKGELKAMRTLGMGNMLSNNLHKLCREMIKRGDVTEEEHKARIQKTYQEYPSTNDMLKTVHMRNIFVLVKE